MRDRLQVVLLRLFPWLALMLLGAPAQALTVVPNPLSFSGGGLAGQATLVGVQAGVPAGGILLGGSVAATATTLLFDVQLTATGGQPTLVAFGVGTTPAANDVPIAGLGWIPGAAADVPAGQFAGSDAVFGFFLSPASLDRVFVSYAGPLVADGSLTLFAGATSNLSQPAPAVASARFVGASPAIPEPHAVLLFALGAACLGLGARRPAP